jgi:hypothetical protein
MTEKDAKGLSELEELRFKRNQRTFSKGFQQATPSGSTEKIANSKTGVFGRSTSVYSFPVSVPAQCVEEDAQSAGSGASTPPLSSSDSTAFRDATHSGSLPLLRTKLSSLSVGAVPVFGTDSSEEKRHSASKKILKTTEPEPRMLLLPPCCPLLISLLLHFPIFPICFPFRFCCTCSYYFLFVLLLFCLFVCFYVALLFV